MKGKIKNAKRARDLCQKEWGSILFNCFLGSFSALVHNYINNN